MTRLTVFICPGCGYETVQPSRCNGVAHECPKRSNRLTDFRRNGAAA